MGVHCWVHMDHFNYLSIWAELVEVRWSILGPVGTIIGVQEISGDNTLPLGFNYPGNDWCVKRPCYLSEE
jgi:hypothetical protein